MPINPLGIYNNPYFGVTKANFVTQVSLVTEQPKYGTNVQVENVILYVPFFSTVESTNTDGSKVYALSSVYGTNKESKMRLSVYENGYYLHSYNPLDNSQSQQRYFSDGSANGTPINFENLKRGNDGNGNSVQNGTRLNDSPNTAENDQFFFNKAEIIVYKTKFNTTTGILEYVDANDVVLANQNDVSLRVVKERLAPGIYLTLNKAFFKKRILEAGSANLINNNEFKQYFIANNQPVYENPSPGNKAGGLTTLEEKSLGAIQKGGSAKVTQVIPYGALVQQQGLTLLQGPGNDAVSSTALAASGATMDRLSLMTVSTATRSIVNSRCPASTPPRSIR